MLKKNTRVRMNGKIGTLVENSYRYYDGVNVDRYCEVLFDGDEYVDIVKVELLEKM